MINRFFWRMVAIIGLIIMGWVCSLMIQSKMASQWPQTKGRMVSASLDIKYLPKYLDWNSGPDPVRWYSVDVKYTYTIADMMFDGDKLSYEVWGVRNAKTALKIMNKYRHLRNVMVYYNPSSLQESILEPGNIGDIYIPLIIGALLTFWGLFFLFDHTTDVTANNIDNHLRAGNGYQRMGKTEEALQEFTAMIEMSPYLAQGYRSRGSLYLKMGKFEEAAVDLSQAASIDPTDPQTHYKRAQAYLGHKKYEKAMVSAQKAIQMGVNVRPQMMEEIQKGLNAQE